MKHEYLKRIVNYNRETGDFSWKSSKAGRNKIPGWSDKDGYLHIRIDYKLWRAHRLAWLYEYGDMPNGKIDHIDRDPGNNSISNLRVVNASQNAVNCKIRSDNKSGYKGVSKRKGLNRWVARTYYNGVDIHIGYFDTPEEASEAYQAKLKEFHGVYVDNAEFIKCAR